MLRYLSVCVATATAAVLMVLSPARAAYVTVDDFESYSPGDINGQSDGSGIWSAHTDFEVAADPADASNQVLSLLDNSGTVDAFNNDPSLTIPDGSSGTLFFRFRREAAGNHVGMGLSDLASPGGDWNHFEALLRSEGNDLDVRDGGTYDELIGNLAADEWFNTWMVVNNTDDKSTVFIQSATSYPTLTQLGNGSQSAFSFRIGTSDPLVTFFMRNAANHDGPWYLDDIHADPGGVNLALPGAEPPPLITAGTLSEDFEDGVADGFQERGTGNGVWAVVDEGGNHVYSQTNSNLTNASGSRLGAYSLAPDTVGDFNLSVDVRTDDTNSAADAALVFGWQNDENYYNVIFNATAENNEVWRIIGGARDQQVGSDFSSNNITDGQFHSVLLERRLDTGLITMSIDGLLVFGAIDTTFGAGRVGVGAFNDAASFDNFNLQSLQAVPEPATALLAALGGLCLIAFSWRKRGLPHSPGKRCAYAKRGGPA